MNRKYGQLNQFFAFIRKEFYHVFRDRKTLLILFALPVAQILMFGYALTNEVKNAKLLIVDPSRNINTQRLISRFEHATNFTVREVVTTFHEPEEYFKTERAQVALIFPENFLLDGRQTNTIQVITDGSNPNFSKTVISYIQAIVGDFLMEMNKENPVPLQIETEVTMLYNPTLEGSTTTIPGVIAMILMIIGTTLTSVSVVREKELGSMEVLLVSPFKPIFVLIAKAVPYLALSLINFFSILLITRFVMHIPINGSLLLLTFAAILFILTSLSIGLLISNLTDSQAAAMLISMMSMLLPTLLLTGFLFPLENMPKGYQWVANIVPARWFFLIIKDVMIKGLSFASIWKESLILFSMSVGLIALSLKYFKIRLQ